MVALEKNLPFLKFQAQRQEREKRGEREANTETTVGS